MGTNVILWVSLLVCSIILVSHTEVASASPKAQYKWDDQSKQWVWSKGDEAEEDVAEEGSGSSYDDEGDTEDDEYEEYGSGGYDDTYVDYEGVKVGRNNYDNYNVNQRGNSAEKKLENEVFGQTNMNDFNINNNQDSYPGQSSVEISEGPAIGNQQERYPETGGNDPFHTSFEEKGPETHDRSKATFFAKTSTMAAVIGGAVVGLLCAILCVMFIVYRMRKKDEGSYALNEPKRSPTVNAYTKAPTREFYA